MSTNDLTTGSKTDVIEMENITSIAEQIYMIY